MASKTTSAAKRGCAGFTLAELLMALGISALAVITLVLFSMFSGRTLLAAGNRMFLEAESRYALDVLTKEMRSSIELKECKTNSISFNDFNNKTLTFEYDATKRQLIWKKQGKADLVLLNDCDGVTFSMFGRVPASGTFDLEPVSNPALCKAVNVTLRTSRTFVAPKIQALNTLTATIVLRMK